MGAQWIHGENSMYKLCKSLNLIDETPQSKL